ncbi:unnamed protein product [Chondrus crispus]|uniref:Uncharacterized protein n=1 Tax=Chondrus crispus TaxID=2769 RepID=R7Q311_CHOCR|nr:unnamed protein product [Chondrus crispus]CDF32409.1 unnamed protein product [Chondrus crispus]|eukprot:XP_005712074.1 unnamed protein product [Chondrus crispus]
MCGGPVRKSNSQQIYPTLRNPWVLFPNAT